MGVRFTGKRNEDTRKAVEVIKQYAAGLSKKDRKKIEEELEKDGDSEEEPSSWITFKSFRLQPTITWSTTGIYHYSIGNDGNWTLDPQAQQIEEDVKDVNFED